MQHHLDTEAAHFVFKEGKGRYLERSRHNENCSHRSGLFTSRPIRYGEGAYGEGRFGGPEQIIVQIDANNSRYVENVLDNALAFLEDEMRSLGI